MSNIITEKYYNKKYVWLAVIGDKAFREGAVSGFLLILFSELGDKTFFIALLLSINKSKAAVFTGTFGALALMSVISVGHRPGADDAQPAQKSALEVTPFVFR